MIISRIFQGLGNQLFQYAFGRAMSIRNKTELKLDATFYKDSEITEYGFTYKRDFEIARYNVEIVTATDNEINLYKGTSPGGIIDRVKHKFIKGKRPKVIHEDLSKFSPEFNTIKGNLYLDGYFTSEEFFKDHAGIIRKEFTLKNQMSEVNNKWAGLMQSTNSVSISYRRGNFLNNPLHETCFMQYYLDGLNEVHKLSTEEITVFIWSDDNDWTEKNFKPPFKCYYMTHNYPDFHEDLRLMTRCKHHVIPNSTFSWWAAWLGEHESQIVVAPEKWLNSDEIYYDHVIPKRWHKIKN